MKNVFLSVLFVVGLAMAQNSAQNWTSIDDTAAITTFRADTLRICKPFPLSQYENLRIDLLIDDTSSAGFASDSIKAFWGFEVGHYVRNANGKMDTFWSAQRVTIDTVSMAATTKFGPIYTGPVDSMGLYVDKTGRMDTLSITGFLVQSRTFAPAWDVIFRPWIKGLTGNKASRFLNARFSIVRRPAVRVRNN